MANPPPPYSNITGISRTVMKDNAQESITNYNGNARPGEMVVDLTNNNIYIGNTDGNLNLINTGGGSGNAEPAGSVGAVQLNAGGNLFGASANLTFVNNSLVTSNIVPALDDTYFLGNSTNRWANIWLGPGTIYMTDTSNVANVAELTVSNGILQVNGATGLQANLIAGNTTLTLSNSGNIAMSVRGVANTVVFANTLTSLNTNVAITDAKTLTVGGTTTLNGNVAVATGKTLKVGGANVVTTTNHGFDVQFTDASGTTAGATTTGFYTLHGDLCYFRINIDFSTCTNFGTGQYQVTLPYKSIGTMTQRSGTLHQVTGDLKYHIAGILDLESHTSNPGDTLYLYYSRGDTDLAYTRTTPASATTVTSHFDITGWYQIA